MRASFRLEQILGSPCHWTHLPIAIEIAYQHPMTQRPPRRCRPPLRQRIGISLEQKLKTGGDHWSLRCQDEVPAPAAEETATKETTLAALQASGLVLV